MEIVSLKGLFELIHLSTVFYSIVILIIVLINNNYFENNYKSFSERILSSFNFSSIFRLFRFSFFLIIIDLIYYYLNYKTSYFNSGHNFVSIWIDDFKDNYLWYLISIIFFCTLICFLFKSRILGNLCEKFETKNAGLFFRYYIIIVIQVAIFLSIFWLANFIIKEMDESLFKNHYYPFLNDEIKFSINDNINLVYKRGVYLTILTTILSFLIIGNALYKIMYSVSSPKVILIFYIFFITLIGVFTGFYSIFNFVVNNFSEKSDSWMTMDKLIGYFPIRLTSIVLLITVLKFNFENLFKGSIKNMFIKFLSPKIHFDYSSNYDSIIEYFNVRLISQIGFYTINIMVYEVLLFYNMDFFTPVLIIVPLIADDFLVVHYYHKIHNSIYWWHEFKITILNISLFFTSAILLLYNHLYLYSVIYLTLSIVFFLSRGVKNK
ncbi:hypothetical protein [Aquirufa aurantiipilula]